MEEFSGEFLTCVRGERVVFRDLDFCLTSGGALVLIGPNGSGKSSLLRVMAGLLTPHEGRLCWNGHNLEATDPAHGSRLQFVGHADGVKPALSVAENLAFWSGLHAAKVEAAARSRAALDRFALARLAELPARFLSAGQRRRLALARLLATPATLWLLDEPRTALDQEAAACLDAAIADHRAEGGMVVLTLHGGAHPPGSAVLDLGAYAGKPW